MDNYYEEFLDSSNNVDNDEESTLSNFIPISESLLLANEEDSKRVIVAAYCYLRSGLDDLVYVDLKRLIPWSGFKCNSRKGKTNEQFEYVLGTLEEASFISSVVNEKDLYEINREVYTHTCDGKQNFSKIFVKELNNIIEYKKTETDKKGFINKANLLLVFAYLRFLIGHYGGYYMGCYSSIAEAIGLSDNIVSKNVQILRDELHLIYTECIHKNSDYGSTTLFCNTYDINKKSGITFEYDEDYCKEIIGKYKQANFEFKNKWNLDIFE